MATSGHLSVSDHPLARVARIRSAERRVLRARAPLGERSRGSPTTGPLAKNWLRDSGQSVIGAWMILGGDEMRRVIGGALEEKVRLEGSGQQTGPVSTEDIQKVIENYRRTKEVIEKIRYGQHL